jgi:hypothetical protein
LWIKQLGTQTLPSASSSEQYYAMSFDSSNNIFLVGKTSGSLGETFGGGAEDIYVTKYNSSGTFQWVKQFGDTTLGSHADGDEYPAYDINIDEYGNVYIGGSTNGNLGETNGGSFDAFMIRFLPD